MKILRLAGAACVLQLSLAAQTSPSPATTHPVDLYSEQALLAKSRELLPQARAAADGSAGTALEKYGDHYTMLTVRTKSGGAEEHDQWADFFFCLEGEATVVTGGSIVQPTTKPGGEIRGTRVEGGTRTMMHKGDVLHISPGVPHQTLVPEGTTFVYFVIKVKG